MTQGSYHVDETEREVVQQFALDPGRPLQLSVSNVHGRIFIRATERRDVWVQATKHGRRGSRAYNRASLRIEADDNVISINPEYGSGSFNSEGFDIDVGLDLGRDIARDVVNGLFGKRSDHERGPESADREESETHSGRPRYDIVVEVPRSLAPDSRISTRTTSGQTGCADLAARLDASSASGDLHLRAITGPVTVQTASGDLLIEGMSGTLTFRAASGDARITGGELSGLNINTASGDLSLQGRLVGHDAFRAQTVSGDVRLELAPPLPEEIVFTSVSGDASVASPFQQTGRKTWGYSQDGGAQLAVKSVSGDLHVSANDAGGSWAATPGFQASAPEPVTHPPPPTPPTLPSPPASPAPATPSGTQVTTASVIPLGAPTENEAHLASEERSALDAASEAERLRLLQALGSGARSRLMTPCAALTSLTREVSRRRSSIPRRPMI